ncbi:MAG TPA: VIT1/CCC1 transporter family protein [Flavitalea sp.]|jgi:VIT1/CCC1 family predicted Fe2+/Mn2+ transporter|nr:VIT1/CCC1 transporter family protein [Flavitalea sp.]
MNRDFVLNTMIGLSDGLMVPFAIAAGMSAFGISTGYILLTCLLISLAGSITMSTGAFLTAKKYEPLQRPYVAAWVIGLSYLLGGMICISPFIFFGSPTESLKWSGVITLPLLFVCGYIEGNTHGDRGWISGIRAALTGSIAAACAYGISQLFK